MANLKKHIKQRFTWVAAMLACFAFLLMAVKVYDVPVATMTGNFLFLLGGLILIIAAAAMLGWLIAYLRKRFR
jgi:hypothetical protein